MVVWMADSKVALKVEMRVAWMVVLSVLSA